MCPTWWGDCGAALPGSIREGVCLPLWTSGKDEIGGDSKLGAASISAISRRCPPKRVRSCTRPIVGAGTVVDVGAGVGVGRGGGSDPLQATAEIVIAVRKAKKIKALLPALLIADHW